MVLDLTKSTRYYRFERELPDAEAKKIIYCKVPCRGKGQSPQPEAVNHAVFEIFRFLLYSPNRFILCHCTHGFNRTGMESLAQHKATKPTSQSLFLPAITGFTAILASNHYDFPPVRLHHRMRPS